MSRSKLAVVVIAVVVTTIAASGRAQDKSADWIAKQSPDLVALYREFHAAPELSFMEVQTAAKLAAELKAAGCEVTTGVGKTGIVGVLKNGAGPTVMLRSDLDALPVLEATGLPYASKVMTKDRFGTDAPAMHACGHDIHITCLIGMARYLSANKDAWRGTVIFLGQPAEEIVSGAVAMLNDGLFTRFPKPDFALALHVDHELPAGKIGHRAGFALANTDAVDVVMRGRGGHGSAPNRAIDPVVQAAHFIVDLQSLVSRENSPFDPAVITVGSIHGGTKHNIIGDSCRMQLTVRSYTPEVRKRLLDGIARKAKAAAASANAPEPTIELSDTTPAMFNDERLVERLVPVFHRALGKENVEPSEPSMGGEDFSRYGLAGVPIFMFKLGSVSPQRLEAMTKAGKPLPTLHSALYYPDPEPTIRTGLTAMSAAVRDLMPPNAGK
jgi:hippurate hydrolase